jgi:AcrR family transcriptional regulator
LASVIELGYSATTSAVVAERAGVSRGAQQYHFPTKGELVAAAVEHLALQIGRELREAAASLPTRAGRADAAIDLTWRYFSAPSFPAVIELIVAARTDPELNGAVQDMSRRLARAIDAQMRDVFGPETSGNRTFGLVMEMTVDLLSGLALQRATLGASEGRHRVERRVVAQWKKMAARLVRDQERAFESRDEQLLTKGTPEKRS